MIPLSFTQQIARETKQTQFIFTVKKTDAYKMSTGYTNCIQPTVDIYYLRYKCSNCVKKRIHLLSKLVI